jgi:hypothetical protein
MGMIRHGLRLFGEILGYARHHKAYWIVPIFVVLALVGMLVIVSQAVAPFIYTIF